MLEKLIESRDTGNQNRRMRGFFAVVGTAMTGLFVAGLIFSIFSTNLAMGSDVIDLSRLIAPALIPEAAPPRPEDPAPASTTRKPEVSRLPERVQNIQRLDEVPVRIPSQISTVPGKYRARPREPFIISTSGDRDGAPGPASNSDGRQRGSNSGGAGFNVSKEPVNKAELTPVALKPSSGPPPLIVKPQKPVTGGVVNGNAIDLVMPVRSAAAVAVNAKGQVTVRVLISETGKVESASAAGGHVLLRSSAVAAALRSKFNPTLLSNQPVKVRGVILYNFK